MPYAPWNSRAITSRFEHWVLLEDFVEVLYQIETINFSIVAERQKALAALAQIPKRVPFSRTSRFSGKNVYINLSRANWPKKWSQIISILNFTTDEVEREAIESASTSTAAPIAHQSVSNAQQIFFNIITSMKSKIKSMQGVFGREEFERNYRLSWTYTYADVHPMMPVYLVN